MIEGENKGGRPYDLEERTELFAKRCRELIRRLPRTLTNREDARQLVRASGSVAGNYLEANDSLSKKDFRMRIQDLPQRGKGNPPVPEITLSQGERPAGTRVPGQ